jgi:hypothetical protein
VTEQIELLAEKTAEEPSYLPVPPTIMSENFSFLSGHEQCPTLRCKTSQDGLEREA